MDPPYYHANAFSSIEIEKNLIPEDPTILECLTFLENLTIHEDPTFWWER